MTARGRSDQALVGTKEAAAIFGVRTQNFLRDWASRADFPAPMATLAATRVWRRSDLEHYAARATPICWPPRRRGLALSPSAARWMPTIKRRIVRGFEPERIVLFGSQARGDADGSSDVDLLVVLSDVNDPRQSAISMQRGLRGIPIPTDIVVTTPQRVARYGRLVGTVLRPALREGVTIYARD